MTSVMALSGWLRLPVIASLACSFLFLINLIVSKVSFRLFFPQTDKHFLAFVIVSLVAFLVNINTASFSHWLTYPWIFIVYCFIPRCIMLDEVKKHGFNRIEKSVLYSLGFCYAFIITDFTLANLNVFFLRELVVSMDNKTANMFYFLRDGIRYTGGLAEEPGVMSFMLNIYFFVFLALHPKPKKIFYALHFLCLFMLGSTNGLFTFLLAIVVANFKSLKTILYIFIALVVFCIAFATYNPMLLDEILLKVTLSDDLDSSSVRAFIWSEGIKIFTENIFLGKGPGYGILKYDSGFTSLGIQVLAELGIMAFILLMFFFRDIVINALQIMHSSKNRYYLAIIVGAIIHLFSINEYFHFPFWFLVGLIQLQKKFTSNAYIYHSSNI